MALFGTCVVFGSTFFTWASHTYGSESLSGWGLVGWKYWSDGVRQVGPHWMITRSWADVPAATAFTALPVMLVCGVATAAALVAPIAVHRRRAVPSTVAAWLAIVSGVALGLCWLMNAVTWTASSSWTLGPGMWLLALGVALVFLGGCFTLRGVNRVRESRSLID